MGLGYMFLQFLPVSLLVLERVLQILVQSEQQSALFIHQPPELSILRRRMLFFLQQMMNDGLGRTGRIDEM